MIMDASPLQLTIGSLVFMLFTLFWVYMAARLGAHGAARSWFDFWKDKNNKGGKRD
jgi:hypothetical protein